MKFGEVSPAGSVVVVSAILVDDEAKYIFNKRLGWERGFGRCSRLTARVGK
jgi:hypothetical protein